MRHLKRYHQLFENYNKYKTIVIFGLPGSGKSYLANQISKKNPHMNYVIYDDYEWRVNGGEKFGKENQIVSDGFLMMSPEYYSKMIKKMGEDKDVDVEFIYFENDPEKSLSNAKERWESGEAKPHQNPQKLGIANISSRYAIPNDVKPLPIWVKPEGNK